MAVKQREHILGTKVMVSDYELISRDLKDIQEMIKDRVACELAQAMVDNDLIVLEESPAYDLRAKEIRAEVVVLDRAEFNRLKRIEYAHSEASTYFSPSFFD
ncbi:hypothetical protein [Priestia aryabhattai]|uniref:hypothetical protein n=1 Tax=Priestia aryabhattai TaxID=412384 RepID=UPI002E234E22|nr:hypothetical protein [Priestia aryabhattai]